MPYRKRPIEVEAVRWMKHGDDPGVTSLDGPPSRLCGSCGRELFDHGWIETKEGGHIVCPGDWIVTGTAGERYPIKPEIFAATYDAV